MTKVAKPIGVISWLLLAACIAGWSLSYRERVSISYLYYRADGTHFHGQMRISRGRLWCLATRYPEYHNLFRIREGFRFQYNRLDPDQSGDVPWGLGYFPGVRVIALGFVFDSPDHPAPGAIAFSFGIPIWSICVFLLPVIFRSRTRGSNTDEAAGKRGFSVIQDRGNNENQP
jgi:hypothetical protein